MLPCGGNINSRELQMLDCLVKLNQRGIVIRDNFSPGWIFCDELWWALHNALTLELQLYNLQNCCSCKTDFPVKLVAWCHLIDERQMEIKIWEKVDIAGHFRQCAFGRMWKLKKTYLLWTFTFDVDCSTLWIKHNDKIFQQIWIINYTPCYIPRK